MKEEIDELNGRKPQQGNLLPPPPDEDKPTEVAVDGTNMTYHKFNQLTKFGCVNCTGNLFPHNTHFHMGHAYCDECYTLIEQANAV